MFPNLSEEQENFSAGIHSDRIWQEIIALNVSSSGEQSELQKGVIKKTDI